MDLTIEVMQAAFDKIAALPPVIRLIKCSYQDHSVLERLIPSDNFFTLEPQLGLPQGFLVLKYTDGVVQLVRCPDIPPLNYASPYIFDSKS